MKFNFLSNKRRQIKLGITLFFILLAAVSATWSISQEKDEAMPFNELFATTSESHLLLFGVLENSFTDEMISGLKSGLPITFNFFVELYLKDIEEPVAQQKFSHTLSYDTLKESYSVLLSEANSRLLQVAGLDEAHRLMSEVNGFKVVELTKLEEKKTYRLRIRAELFEKTLPMGFHRILPFLSLWDLETDWQTLQFNY